MIQLKQWPAPTRKAFLGSAKPSSRFLLFAITLAFLMLTQADLNRQQWLDKIVGGNFKRFPLRTSQVAAEQLMNGQQVSNSQLNLNQNNASGSIIIEQSFSGAQLLLPANQHNQANSNSNNNNNNKASKVDNSRQHQQEHIQPSFVLGTRNRSINFTHLIVDETTGTVYVGATNWLFQLSASDLRAEYVLRTGPGVANSSDFSRDCAPADCSAHIAHVEAASLPMHHERGDLSLPSWSQSQSQQTQPNVHLRRFQTHSTTSSNSSNGFAFLSAPRSNQQQQQHQHQQRPAGTSPPAAGQSQSHNNNYNKILAIEPESRTLVVCGSLNQGACRKHQLNQLANYSDLIPLPVASNDEHSSSVALILPSQSSGASIGGGSSGGQRGVSQGGNKQPIMYVAATNSKLGPYREMVPAISARYLEPPSKAMQIIEKSFTDSARIDISFELRDYYLVNYIYAFQHNDFVYFATVQRKSPLRQLEEWGYITRLARLCLSDLSFQSYTELTLECRSSGNSNLNSRSQTNSTSNFPNSNRGVKNRQQQQQVSSSSSSSSSSTSSSSSSSTTQNTNYNLLQDAHLTLASSHLAHQLGVRAQSAVLATVFAQSKDHTTKSQQKSAICLFPIEKIEAKFNENIHLCYNGSSKARNMNYIAGSVNDCPRPGKAGNIANFCNEPIKLNGSLPLQAQAVMSFEDELLTSITATQAPTSPLNYQQQQQQQQPETASTNTFGNTHHSAFVGSLKRAALAGSQHRQHQVLIAGTSEGSLKRIVLLSGENGFGVRGHEFDQVQVDETHQEPILSDLHLWPSLNPQLVAGSNIKQPQTSEEAQFALLGTPSRVVKFRVNSCRHSSQQSTAGNTSSNVADQCNACAQLQDPFCGWCASSATCSTREQCLNQALQQQQQQQQPVSVHWSPFDQIKCADYQPVWPKFAALHSTSQTPIEVNVRLLAPTLTSNGNNQAKVGPSSLSSIALQLAQAQFTCHFDYISLANRSVVPMMRLSGATTKATQARLNLHTGTVVIACPLPPISQRPQTLAGHDELQTKLSVRVLPFAGATTNGHLNTLGNNELTGPDLQQILGLSSGGSGNQRSSLMANLGQTTATNSDEIERQITFYDCAVHSNCKSCLSAGNSAGLGRHRQAFACSWCPLSNKCTFNASHPEFGCAASAVSSTTPHSSSAINAVRASHLTSSLDSIQASVFGMSIERLNQCPSISGADQETAEQMQQQQQQPAQSTKPDASRPLGSPTEILIPHNSHRSIQVQLKQTLSLQQRRNSPKLECLIEIEGAKARLGARLSPNEAGNQLVICQESSFAYNEETSTQQAQLLVILNENQVIETFEVILYKCHLFGLSPPALTSTIGSGSGTHSSVAWRAHELFQVTTGPTTGTTMAGTSGPVLRRHARASTSDCSLCLNVERKFQCSWCGNQCLHSDHCTELPASTCPPPRIDSIHPTSGPLEGGTLITIEGSNLGSNEREIQDKISVGGENCQLVMYSVSTRIVCKTNPSTRGVQAATVFVGNRAGVTSAYEKFHYKAVHLTDVSPHVGPVSGGTRLYLTGSNLNIGSRVQIFLDDIPCSLDVNDITNNQISCITAPNLLASSMRITKLTLMIDNATHYLPYPFTYQPDPIITNIEPAESFVSGGRLILITGQHLASPQSTKLMVYHEHKPNIINGTSCIPQNDTLITCLTPALSRDMLASGASTAPDWPQTSSNEPHQQQQQQLNQIPSLSYESGGLKLKMSLFMDDVRSVRNLDEYYHHLPHYLTYFEDPQLFRLQTPVVDYTSELIIGGENLKMKQLDQDLLITIGSHICAIKSLQANQVVCETPEKISPIYEDISSRRVIENPILPIIALVGSNLKYHIGHMQYSSSQYQVQQLTQQQTDGYNYQANSGISARVESSSTSASSPSVAILIFLSVVGFIIGFAATFMFALSRFRHSKAERDYKRIQLQMGALDVTGQLVNNGSLFDNITIGKSSASSNQTGIQSARSRALDYVGGAFSSKKLFNQLNQQLPSFPPSPLTDISSLTGSNPSAAAHNQHFVRLSSNGTIINSTMMNNQHLHQQSHNNNSANSNSSQSSPSSTRNYGLGSQANNNHLFAQNQNSFSRQLHQQQHQQQHQLNSNSDKSNLLSNHHQSVMNGTSRNYSWTQEAPSTIVPYAVIEACNLTLEGKNAIKEYV